MASDGFVRVEAAWFTPSRLLLLFCLMSLLIYLDRGTMSSAAVSGNPGGDAPGSPPPSGLQGEFGISYYQYGWLQAAFMIGLLCGSPVFSALAKRANPFRLIAVGLGTWTVATMACATSPNYSCLFLARTFVGVGEASFCALAAPFIDDFAPRGKKATWLACFYLCIPLGVALGFMYGGVVGGAPRMGWRWAFALESAAMLPVVMFCVSSAPIPMRGVSASSSSSHVPSDDAGLGTMTAGGEGSCESDAESDDDVVDGDGYGSDRRPRETSRRRRRRLGISSKTAAREFLRDAAELTRHPIYVATVAGYVAYTAVIGVYAVWGPKAAYAVFSTDLNTPSRADLVLGLVTVVAGAGGTAIGGVAVDRLGDSVGNALAVCAVSGAAGFILLETAFVSTSFPAFLAFFLLGETAAFVTQAPINAVVLWSVPPGARPLACSMTTVAIHALGDVPTPPLFGATLQALAGGGALRPEHWRVALCAFTAGLLVSAGVLARTAMRAGSGAGRGAGGREGDDGEQGGDGGEGGSAPLLGGSE